MALANTHIASEGNLRPESVNVVSPTDIYDGLMVSTIVSLL
jgi:hypothetical protein